MSAAPDTNNQKSAEHMPKDEMSEESFLKAYKKKEYPKPSLTVDIAVFRRTQEGLDVLMIRRGRHPYQGCWALPGGFAEPKEDVQDAAWRELEEETGVTDVPIELFGIYGAPGRDPRGWTVSGGFCTVIDDDGKVHAGDDAADARWCRIQENACEAQGGNAGELSLLVTCGDGEQLSAHFKLIDQRFGAPRARVVDSTGFAFDHAQLVADAYLKVTRR